MCMVLRDLKSLIHIAMAAPAGIRAYSMAAAAGQARAGFELLPGIPGRT